MEKKKATKRQMLETIRTRLTNEDEIAFIDHELELLAKKNASREAKPTAKQKENTTLKEVILDFMGTDGERYQIKELLKAIPELEDVTSQRATALMRQLREDGFVERITEGRSVYFAKVERWE